MERFIALSLLSLTMACAPLNEDLRTSSVIQGATPTFPSSGSTAGASSADSLSASVVDALAGTYTATLAARTEAGSLVEQPMQFAIRKVVAAQTGERWLYAVVTSSGPLGSIQFETFLGLGLSGLYNTYSLSTPTLSLPSLSSNALAFQLVLRMNASGTQVDPTQSGIFVKDCGFAQYLGCGTMAEDVWFSNNRLSKL
jgi:hypothetical protein